MIQSQQVTITGTDVQMRGVLDSFAEEMVRYMLADAQGSVTEQSQQKSRQDGEA